VSDFNNYKYKEAYQRARNAGARGPIDMISDAFDDASARSARLAGERDGTRDRLNAAALAEERKRQALEQARYTSRSSDDSSPSRTPAGPVAKAFSVLFWLAVGGGLLHWYSTDPSNFTFAVAPLLGALLLLFGFCAIATVVALVLKTLTSAKDGSDGWTFFVGFVCAAFILSGLL
jgi:hypothetical protein